MDVLDHISKKMRYAELLQTEEWNATRSKILKRDLHTCRNCGSTNNLHVHHRQYHECKKTGDWKKPWEYEAKYLITLCETCHEAGHRQYSIPTKII